MSTVKSLAIALLLILACAPGVGWKGRGAPDAGSEAGALAPSPEPESAPTSNRTVDAVAPPAPSDRRGAPTDPRVMACIDKATDKATLMGCLDQLKGQIFAPDAGAPKFGATRPPPINPAWSIPSWYVNSSTGSANNTCVTAGSPCPSWAEIVARWTTNAPLITTGVTITFLADNPVTDPVDWRPIVFGNGGGIAFLQGVRSLVATTTIASLSAKNRASSGAYPLGLLQANLGASQAAGLLAVNTSRSSSVAWIDSVISGPLSVLTQPLAENVGSWNTAPGENDAWANGDNVTLFSVTRIYMTAYDAISATGDMSGDARFVRAGNLRIVDATGSGHGLLTLSNLVHMSEVRVDPFVANAGQPNISGPQFVNVWAPAGVQACPVIVVGGSYGTANRFCGVVDGDAILRGTITIGVTTGLSQSVQNVSATNLGLVYIDNSTGTFAVTRIFGDTLIEPVEYGSNALYGRYTLRFLSSSLARYIAPAASTFLGIGAHSGNKFEMYATPNANAYDPSVTPAQWYPARSLTPAQLDTSIASGGFGGNAYGDSDQVIAVDNQQASAAPANYCAGVANCGTGVSTVCLSGQCLVSNGTNYVCQTCGSSSLPDPVTVTHGGTGQTALTAHAVLVGEGSSTLVEVGPGGAGIPLVGEGASADPAFGVAVVAGGGTGDTAHCSNCVLVGQGSANILDVGPGALGTFFLGQGSGSAPAFVALPVAEATGSGTITTTLTTALSISLVVASGQKAYIWATAWFESTDTNVHIILMTLNATTESKVGIGATGSVFDEVNGTYMASDATVGTNTYNLKLALDTALGAGVVNYPVATLRGQVR
jgi:hypothetical protein